MNQTFKLPPKSKDSINSLAVLTALFSPLIGRPFTLTGKPRTDGSNLRKLIAGCIDSMPLLPTAQKDDFELLIKKGLPKILSELLDTYLVTSGESYNLQIWNRAPGSGAKFLRYADKNELTIDDIRYVFVKIDVGKSVIAAIVVCDSIYLAQKFGSFGAQTIKHQLMISAESRQAIISSQKKLLFYPDTHRVARFSKAFFEVPRAQMKASPTLGDVFSIEILREKVALKIIGNKLEKTDTKSRGQLLERLVLSLLGYESSGLHGGYPDIPNQLLEVKVQEAQTIDLGQFSPAVDCVVIAGSDISTQDIRYLIALTDPKTGEIVGVVLAPGKELIAHFNLVKSTSFKVQKAIKMGFFDAHEGQCVFNPTQ